MTVSKSPLRLTQLAAKEKEARRFPELEAHFGQLTAMHHGMQSRVYVTKDHQTVVKVYRSQNNEHRLEATHMQQAGLGDLVVDVLDMDGVEALVLKRFPGKPVNAQNLLQALPQLRQFLATLHQKQQGRVDQQRIQNRLRRFRSTLAPYDLGDLFDAIEIPFQAGQLDVPAAFCHLDLWHDNILIAQDSDHIQVIDWNKAGWDDPLRDLALLKTGTLDLLSSQESLQAALSFLPDEQPETYIRYRAYVSMTTLHDLYWFLMNEPYHFEEQQAFKIRRARYFLKNTGV